MAIIVREHIMTDFAATPNSVQASGSSMDLVLRAARDGAADASEAAAKFWSQAGSVLARAVYVTAYTISYGVVFPVALAARSVPHDNSAQNRTSRPISARQRRNGQRAEAVPTQFQRRRWRVRRHRPEHLRPRREDDLDAGHVLAAATD